MAKWQKYWLYFVIAVSLFHLARDLMQDAGIKNFATDFLVKDNKPSLFIFNKYNTYFIEVTELALSGIALKNSYFGTAGLLTIIIALVTIIGFSIYWFYF